MAFLPYTPLEKDWNVTTSGIVTLV